MARVVLTDIEKSFISPEGNKFEALKAIQLDVASGESFSLLGHSGCGKSTLLRIIAGLEPPDAGRIEFDGKDHTSLPPEKRPTAMVFQNYALFPHMTVEANVAFGLKVRKLPRPEIEKKVNETLELVQLSGLNRRKMGELSGGQQQRVALARVLAIEPKIILMDEPLSNLDAALRRTTRSIIRRIQQELGLTMIYVTHDQEEALMISDRIALMERGRIVQQGSPREFYEAPTSIEGARFVGQRNVIEVYVHSIEAESISVALSKDADTPRLTIPKSNAGAELKVGDSAWLAFRADEAEVSSSEANSWPGEVQLASYAGTHLEVEIAPDAKKDISIRVNAPKDVDSALTGIGSRVRIQLKPGAGLIFPRRSE